jgi:hypothetical protein
MNKEERIRNETTKGRMNTRKNFSLQRFTANVE